MTSHARSMLRVLTISNNATQHSWIARMLPIFRVLFIALYLGSLALAGYGLYQGVQTGDWEYLWKQMDTFRIGAFMPLALAVENMYGHGATSELVCAFAAIRVAAVHGDERIAPLAANQPLPLTEALDMRTTWPLGPLHGPLDSMFTRPVYTFRNCADGGNSCPCAGHHRDHLLVRYLRLDHADHLR